MPSNETRQCAEPKYNIFDELRSQQRTASWAAIKGTNHVVILVVTVAVVLTIVITIVAVNTVSTVFANLYV